MKPESTHDSSFRDPSGFLFYRNDIIYRQIIGWGSSERFSFIKRGPADAVLALALAHYPAISNNVPLPKIAAFFSEIRRWLVIEFVPKSDSQVQRLLASRKDIFVDYTQDAFENSIGDFFTILKTERLRDSGRTLYLARGKGNPV